MPVNGIALTSISIGSVLVWSGLKGWNLTRTVGEIITGQMPKGTEEYALTASSGNVASPSATSSALANIALSYKGHAYTYGGAPGKDGKNNWDCSSFMNWVVGHDGKRAIPGYGAGQYDGTSHGPPTGSWGIWPGLQHIKASEVQAGDIIVWVGHMGMAIDNTHMISALNSKLGTLVTSIAGHGNGPIMAYGRLR